MRSRIGNAKPGCANLLQCTRSHRLIQPDPRHDGCVVGLVGRHTRRHGAGSHQVDGHDRVVTASNQPSHTNRSDKGARRTSMNCHITNRTLTAAMSMMATVATRA